jgi:hypothetical protein
MLAPESSIPSDLFPLMSLKPWYDVIKPRAEMRDLGRALDAGEFAVHLDEVRDGRARADYQKPEVFFSKTFLAANLLDLSSQVVRRLSGEAEGTSSVFNLATQFGGGKTHALTLLWHLATSGPQAAVWTGVPDIIKRAGTGAVPKANVAVFVGTEFDSIAGRGGDDGTPKRYTPWGEIAWQLRGQEGFEIVAEHDAQRTAPGGDVVRKVLGDQPTLIMMDELMNYVSRFRAQRLGDQFYNFLHILTENLGPRSVLVVSVPASELEMTQEDHDDYNRITKMLNRKGRAIPMTAGSETAEIIRRRLFEWTTPVGAHGRVLLPKEATAICKAQAEWFLQNQGLMTGTLQVEHAQAEFERCYPFHPALLSVFERKWQVVPKFQQTRGVLKLLAMWVARAYSEGTKKLHKDPIITLGTAPLEDSIFRREVFAQLGNDKVEAAVITDIAGQPGAHAVRLDQEAHEAVRKARLHQQVASVIFFESNGGTVKAEATTTEIRFAVGAPGIELGELETVLEALSDACYYLTIEKKAYRFSIRENLNKRFADRKAVVPSAQVDEMIRKAVEQEFKPRSDVDRVFFKAKSGDVPDKQRITFVIGSPEQGADNEATAMKYADEIIRQAGNSSRTFKSAVVVVLPDQTAPLYESARRALAWETIWNEVGEDLDHQQQTLTKENIAKAKRDLRDAVWRAYKHVFLLDKDNVVKRHDMGTPTHGSADSPIGAILEPLHTLDVFSRTITPAQLIKNWPPAFQEWPLPSVRDAFYASPAFPRVLNPEAIKDAISKGVSDGRLGYAEVKSDGTWDRLRFEESTPPSEISFSDGAVLVTKETAKAWLESKKQPVSIEPEPTPLPSPSQGSDETVTTPTGGADPTQPGGQTLVQPELFNSIEWEGDIPPQKWMMFYNKVLAKLTVGSGLKLTVKVDASPEGGISKAKLQETKHALQELGLIVEVKTK